MEKIAVVGAGSWGTALAIVLGTNGHNVALWAREAEAVANINKDRENIKYLKGCPLPESVVATNNLDKAIAGSSAVVLSVPSHAVREVTRECRPFIEEQMYIINTAKGFELETLKYLSTAIEEELGSAFQDNIVVLSGPSHAEEAGRSLPTVVVSTARKRKAAEYVQDIFMSNVFRVYTTPDLLGVQLAGALKNVIALATGISDGLGFGDNSKAALMTRGIAEITRLGMKMGADVKTFAGLAGIGDLIVTCTSMHSRNRRAGIQIGEGKNLEEVLQNMGMVVEGVRTTQAAMVLAEKYQVEMPITTAVYRVLFENLDPNQAVQDLMMRGKKNEMEELANQWESSEN